VAQRFGIAGGNWPSEDYFMWAVAVRQPEGAGTGEYNSSALTHLASQTVDGFHDDFLALVRSADANHTVPVPVRATPPSRQSAASRVTLIGDAMHTMPPFGAHGANTAFKDAQVLKTTLPGRVPGVRIALARRCLGKSRSALPRLGMSSTLEKFLKLCTTKVPSPPETEQMSHAIFRTKPTKPDITDVSSAASGPRYRGSNPCLPAN